MIILFICCKVFTICAKRAPKLGLKNHPASPFQALFHKKSSFAFPLSGENLKPPYFEQKSNGRIRLKGKSQPNVFPVETWLKGRDSSKL